MRKSKIVADSSADVLYLEGVDFALAPLKIETDARSFTDDAALRVEELVSHLAGYKGKSRSSCPNTADWLAAFGDAEEVYCVTITGGLSGSCNTARSAKLIYEGEHAGRRVLVVDSRSAGPEVRLILEKLREYIKEGLSFGEIAKAIAAYQKQTGLLFALKSLKNLANNGRVSPILAKIVGLAGIRVLGKASDAGTLENTDKCRGEARALQRLTELLREAGLRRGRVCIHHCQNEAGAEQLKALIGTACPEAAVTVSSCRGLCSFYAEQGGLLIGFEKM